MKFFFIPLSYTYKTRLRSFPFFLSWIAIYPLLLLLFIFFYEDVSIYTLSIFSLSILLTYNLYEIGYIENDTETIKKEKKPTMRLSESELIFYYKNKLLIYTFRMALSVLLSISIFLINPTTDKLIIAYPYLILILYFIYNKVRGKLNLPIHFALVTVRYSAPILITLNDFSIENLIFIILIFPFINLIERCGEKRFDFTFIQEKTKNKNKLRVIYYFTLTIFLFFASLYDVIYIPLLICSNYIFLYRLISPYIFSIIKSNN